MLTIGLSCILLVTYWLKGYVTYGWEGWEEGDGLQLSWSLKEPDEENVMVYSYFEL